MRRLRNGTFASGAAITAMRTLLGSMTASDRLLARRMAAGQDPGSAFRERHKIKAMSEEMRNITLCMVRDDGKLQDAS